MGKASTRGRAPGCGGKAEVWKKADEDEALMLSDFNNLNRGHGPAQGALLGERRGPSPSQSLLAAL